MRNIIFYVLLSVWSSIGRAEELLDRILATVNGSPVLLSEVQEKVNQGPLVVISDYPSDEKSPPFQRALNDAINWKMAALKADELGIEIEDAEVEKEIGLTLQRLRINRDQLKQRLAYEGGNYEEYTEDTRDFLRLKRFQGRVIQPLIKITERDLETFYLKKSGVGSEAVELKLRQILIAVSVESPKEVHEAKARLAQTVYQKLIDGAPFSELAKVYSDDAYARESGGELPAMRLGDLNSKIQLEVSKLEPTQFTVPIKTALGWHIFMLEDKKFTVSKGYIANKNKLQDELFFSEVQEQTRRWVIEQRRRSKIVIIEQ